MLYKVVVISFFVFLFTSCEKVDESMTAEKQIERIESYVKSQYPQYTIDNDVYIVKTNKVDNTNNTRLSAGDSLYINYAQYLFTTTQSTLFNTNIKTVAEGNHLYNGSMAYEPLGLVYGKSKIIAGLEIGLKNKIMGDSLMLYITSDNAYKNKANGVVPKNTPITMFVHIEKIVKNN